MGGRPKFSYDFVKQTFESRGCKLLETEYINKNQQLHYIAACGHERTCSFNNFYRGKGTLCWSCWHKAVHEKSSLGEDRIRSVFEAEGMTVLDIAGRTNTSKVRYIARCGHENVSDYAHFVTQNAGRVCNRCSKSIRYTDEFVRSAFADEGCELMDEYVNCKISLRFRGKCGHETHITFDRFMNDKNYSKMCRSCASEAVKRGELSPGRYTPEMQEWRDDVYRKADYTCQVCGQRGGDLQAHHLYNYRSRPDLAYDLDNGVALCKMCHRSFHSFAGTKTTPKDFQDFKEMVIQLSGNTEVTVGTKEPTAP